MLLLLNMSNVWHTESLKARHSSLKWVIHSEENYEISVGVSFTKRLTQLTLTCGVTWLKVGFKGIPAPIACGGWLHSDSGQQPIKSSYLVIKICIKVDLKEFSVRLLFDMNSLKASKQVIIWKKNIFLDNITIYINV